MQMVVAKCIMNAWDSVACLPYNAGKGPLPGGLFEIDRDGPLAKLKTPKGNWVFEFDRNAGPDDKPHVYTCKRPGCEALKPFKTLAALGSHTKTAHKEVRVEDDEEEEEPVAKKRGAHSGRTFTCKVCGDVLPNLYAMGQHNKTAHQPVQPEIETETAVSV